MATGEMNIVRRVSTERDEIRKDMTEAEFKRRYQSLSADDKMKAQYIIAYYSR